MKYSILFILFFIYIIYDPSEGYIGNNIKYKIRGNNTVLLTKIYSENRTYNLQGTSCYILEKVIKHVIVSSDKFYNSSNKELQDFFNLDPTKPEYVYGKDCDN